MKKHFVEWDGTLPFDDIRDVSVYVGMTAGKELLKPLDKMQKPVTRQDVSGSHLPHEVL